MISKKKLTFFLIVLVIGCSLLQGENTAELSGIIRQARVGVVMVTYGLLLGILAVSHSSWLHSKISLPSFFLALYLSVSFISLFGHPEWLFGVWKLLEFFMYVLWVFVIRSLLKDRIVEAPLFGLNVILAVVAGAVILAITFEPSLAWNYIPSVVPFQLRGGYLPINSNDLAMILLVGIMYLQVVKPKIRLRSFILVVLVGLLFATQNRTSLVYFLVFSFFKVRVGWLIVLGGSVALLMNPVLLGLIQNAASRGDISNVITGNGRLIIWVGVIEQISGSIGIGRGFYVGHRFATFEAGHFLLENSNTFDNTFLDIAFDTGIVGLLFFVSFLLAIIIRIYRGRLVGVPTSYISFMRWLAPFFLIDAMMGPTVQTFGLTLAIYALAFMPLFSDSSLHSASHASAEKKRSRLQTG